uniref:lipocalin family protein n=1 Tax=Pedobacter schmidteae TaxID=2201271 RepID=UPI000EAF2AC3|nr:lipocalin family protein [Pedobacter schmidteae]
MRKQITFAISLFILTAGITSCQKDKETSTKKDVAGKWQVVKIETTVAGAPVVTYTGVAADYFEFRNNEEDEVVVNYNGSNYIGTYVVMDNKLINLSYNGKLRTAQITTISASQLEFTANVEGATVKTTEKFYFKR